METYFDFDGIECVTIKNAKKRYPALDWEMIENRFSWDAGEMGVYVMALADLNLCVKLFNENKQLDSYKYTEIHHCSVCRKVLLPGEDDAYTDEKTSDCICDEHSRFNNSTGNYYKVIFGSDTSGIELIGSQEKEN